MEYTVFNNRNEIYDYISRLERQGLSMEVFGCPLEYPVIGFDCKREDGTYDIQFLTEVELDAMSQSIKLAKLNKVGFWGGKQ
ncbi:hypothetical protein [uncultured Mediterranean phage uvMED]|nr:hypothetical protein [uncultured Mediterranean phage uvMED]